MEPLVHARGLAKRHGRRAVLQGVGLDLFPGEIVALTGANGAGKTTLLRILATLDRADAGTLRLFGADPAEEAAPLRARMGYAGHLPGLYPELTLRENLHFFLGFYPGFQDPARRGAAIEDALTTFGLKPLAEARAAGFSRGEHQRAALARAFAHAPDLLLLDEPFTGLDDAGAEALTHALGKARDAGQAVCFSTHLHGIPRATRTLRVESGRVRPAEEVKTP